MIGKGLEGTSRVDGVLFLHLETACLDTFAM